MHRVKLVISEIIIFIAINLFYSTINKIHLKDFKILLALGALHRDINHLPNARMAFNVATKFHSAGPCSQIDGVPPPPV